MKLGIIIPDGAADLPIKALDGKTPLEAAITPHLDRLAAMGRQGTVNTTPPGFGTGSDVCSMSLLGYDPTKYHTGRAPIEAAATGLSADPTDVVCRINLVTIEGGMMRDHSAGGIDTSSGRALFKAVAQAWREAGLFDTCEIKPGVEYRCSLVDRSGTSYDDVRTTPPHEILDEVVEPYGPNGGQAADRLSALMEAARPVLASHAINAARVAEGKPPATDVWIWGQGVFPSLPSFERRFGLRGAMTTAVDLLAGIASLVGWHRLDVPGLTGWHDNDYAAQGTASMRALDDYDIVCCHVESPDEAAHRANPTVKTAAVEAIDRHCVGPMLDRLSRDPEWRLLVLPDHYTLCSTRKHDPTPPPYLIAGTGIEADDADRFTETNAQAGGPHLQLGHDLIPSVLLG
ncbi:MAG: 2,3-bisphosphoglycerate-independent phosphoglycerate mutase [Planctomycetota bacterium]